MRRRDCARLSSVDTGSLRGDLHEIARIVGEDRRGRGGVPFAALNRALESDPELVAALYGEKAEPETLRRVVERAVRRGEVAPDNPALEFVADLVVGVAYGRSAIGEEEADAAYLVRYLEASVLPVLLRR
ncbi:TetR-like C-terminal domain-containing protein [Streptomyces diastatochromogenes]|nr:TetR-like C-terminal domain-containing protein [Streptomyces diastatochromogenes]